MLELGSFLQDCFYFVINDIVNISILIFTIFMYLNLRKIKSGMNIDANNKKELANAFRLEFKLIGYDIDNIEKSIYDINKIGIKISRSSTYADLDKLRSLLVNQWYIWNAYEDYPDFRKYQNQFNEIKNEYFHSPKQKRIASDIIKKYKELATDFLSCLDKLRNKKWEDSERLYKEERELRLKMEGNQKKGWFCWK